MYAASDVANAAHPFYSRRVRVGTGPTRSTRAGRGAQHARARAGPPTSRKLFSDQFDVGMEYSGLARRTDEVVFRGDPARAS